MIFLRVTVALRRPIFSHNGNTVIAHDSWRLWIMSRTSSVNQCQGLHTGAPCPDNRCDSSVRFGFYDVFLCPSNEMRSDDAADNLGQTLARNRLRVSPFRLFHRPQVKLCNISDSGNDDGAIGSLNDGTT